MREGGQEEKEKQNKQDSVQPFTTQVDKKSSAARLLLFFSYFLGQGTKVRKL